MEYNNLFGAKITVCLLYNHAHLLESLLASIQQQTLTGYDILVSDDCSTDATWPLLQRWPRRSAHPSHPHAAESGYARQRQFRRGAD